MTSPSSISSLTLTGFFTGSTKAPSDGKTDVFQTDDPITASTRMLPKPRGGPASIRRSSETSTGSDTKYQEEVVCASHRHSSELKLKSSMPGALHPARTKPQSRTAVCSRDGAKSRLSATTVAMMYAPAASCAQTGTSSTKNAGTADSATSTINPAAIRIATALPET